MVWSNLLLPGNDRWDNYSHIILHMQVAVVAPNQFTEEFYSIEWHFNKWSVLCHTICGFHKGPLCANLITFESYTRYSLANLGLESSMDQKQLSKAKVCKHKSSNRQTTSCTESTLHKHDKYGLARASYSFRSKPVLVIGGHWRIAGSLGLDAFMWQQHTDWWQCCVWFLKNTHKLTTPLNDGLWKQWP